MVLYSPESVYQLDQAAVAQDGFSEIELMQRAGERAWQHLLERWPEVVSVTVFAGAGNNGGDAFVVALCAQRQGVKVQLLVQGDLARQSATSQHFTTAWQQAGGTWEEWQQQELYGDVIVDGLLGIGLKRELDDHWQALISSINRSAAPRLALDIPSGLNGLTGVPQPVAIEAQLTVTFIGAKTGQFLADGPDYCGELVVEDLGVSSRTRDSVVGNLRVLQSCRLPPPRKKNSHKNHYGHVLIVGGDLGMSGAVLLSAHAALRCGAGLVTALVNPECCNNIAAVPEIMVLGWDALESRLAQASVIVAGPGLGDSQAANECLRRLQPLNLPIVVDASALKTDFLKGLNSRQLVITPHPGEAGLLLSSSSAEIQANRLAACQQLIESFGGSCVLKGSGTLIADSADIAINTRGNPGMASAGMGDVLSGMIAALMGQGLTPSEAAETGVYIHALAAEAFSQKQDQTGLLASDIIDRIPLVIKQLRDGC